MSAVKTQFDNKTVTWELKWFRDAAGNVSTKGGECGDVLRTCVLYSPGLCERRIWRNRLSFPDRHVLNKGHGRRVDVGTFKVIICTNSSLQVPVPTQKKEQGVNGRGTLNK